MNKFEEDLIAEAKHSCLAAGILNILLWAAICIVGFLGIKDFSGSLLVALWWDLMVIVGICELDLTIIDMRDRLRDGYYKQEFEHKLKIYGISINDLEKDMKYATAFKKCLFGEKYFLKKGKDLDVIPYCDLMWVYLKTETKEYFFGEKI